MSEMDMNQLVPHILKIDDENNPDVIMSEPRKMESPDLLALHEEDLIADTDVSDPYDTPSLTSSIWEYQYENGRRYHRTDLKHLLPNDETEQDRLDLHHHIFMHLLGGQICLAPIRNPKRILDVGTGTGIWALEMAELHPEAEVIAIDTTPIQPTWTVPNCTFEIDDAEKDWLWPENHFDFIHSRNLAQGIHDWTRYLKQMYRASKPGGYIELMEINIDIYSDDNTIPPDSNIMKVSKLWGPAAAKAGLRILNGDDFVQLVRDAGFTNIQMHALKQPWSHWPKDPTLKYIGRCMQLILPNGIHAYHMALFTRILGMSSEEAHDLCNKAIKDAQNRNIHIYNFVYNVYAMKPFEDCA